MKLSEVLAATEDEILIAIKNNDLSNASLVDRRSWSKVRQCLRETRQSVPRDTSLKLCARRYQCYSELPDHRILSQLANELIPADVLADDRCWIRICQVRGRYRDRVEPALWKRTCSARGEWGVSAGPYS